MSWPSESVVHENTMDPSCHFMSIDTKLSAKSHAQAFLKNNHFFYYSSEKPPSSLLEICPKPTVTSYVGGSAYIPPTHFKAFLRAAAQDAKENIPACWTQVGYDRYGTRFAVDIDSTILISDELLMQLLQTLQETLRCYYPDTSKPLPPIFVAKTTPPTLKIKSDGPHLAEGLHIFVHLTDHIERFRQIIYGFQLRLKQRHINLAGLNIDADIYRMTSKCVSMRMVYSHNKKSCPVCNNDQGRKLTCDFCRHHGVVLPKSLYEPYWKMSDDGKVVPFEFKNWEDVFSTFSLWPIFDDDHKTIESRDDYKQPDSDPSYTLAKGDPNPSKMVQPARRKGADGKLHDVPYAAVDRKHRCYEVVTDYLRRLQHCGKFCWPRIDVENIMYRPKSPVLIIVRNFDSTYCNYVERPHESNRIFFAVYKSESKLKQRCHATACKGKDHIQFQIPSDVLSAIYDSIPNQKPLKKNMNVPEFNMWEL